MLKKLKFIFNKKQKTQLFLLTLIILVGAFFELISVSAILPIVYLIMDDNIIYSNIILYKIYVFLNLKNTKSFIIFMLILIIIIYFVKNIFLIMRNYFKFSFINNTQRHIAKRMMVCYIKQPYLFHTQYNSATIQRSIVNDVGTFVAYVLAFIDLLVGAITSIILIAYLFITDFTITFILLGIFIFFTIFLLKPLNKILNKYGNVARESGANMIQWINQSLGGIKELKILGKEVFFINKFSDEFKKSSNSQKMDQFLSGLPGLIMEFLCLMGIITVIIIKISAGESAATLIPILSVVAFAGFRLLNSFTLLTTSASRMFFTKPAVDALYHDLIELEILEKQIVTNIVENKKEIFLKHAIILQNVSFQYSNSQQLILNKCNLEITSGTSIAFIGSSGSGKTTLADLILGVLEQTSGEVFLDGKNRKEIAEIWKQLFGYIPQNIYLMDDTIRNNIAFGVSEDQVDDENIWRALKDAQLSDFVQNLELGLDTVIGEGGARISGGQRQRIGIARALYNKPEILVLDEATSALDQDTEKTVMEAIENLHGKITMIIIAHRLTTIKNCDFIYEVKNGNIIKLEKGILKYKEKV